MEPPVIVAGTGAGERSQKGCPPGIAWVYVVPKWDDLLAGSEDDRSVKG
jgi:hypothetical protein